MSEMSREFENENDYEMELEEFFERAENNVPAMDAPAAQGTGVPAAPGTGVPAAPGTGVPAAPGTGVPAAPGTGLPAAPGTGIPAPARQLARQARNPAGGVQAAPAEGGGRNRRREYWRRRKTINIVKHIYPNVRTIRQYFSGGSGADPDEDQSDENN